MHQSALEQAFLDFQNNFSIGEAHNTVQSLRQSFKWAELGTIVQNHAFPHTLVALHHGLDGQNVRYMFRIINGTPRANLVDFDYREYDPTDPDPLGRQPGAEPRDPMYLLHNNDFLRINTMGEVTTWRNMEQAYVRDMRVNNAGTWEGIASGDPRILVFPWAAELRELYLQNCPGAVCVYIVEVRPIVQPEPTAGALPMHGVAFHLKSNGRDLLDDHDYVLPFTNKGADLGNRCPPRCREYVSPM